MEALEHPKNHTECGTHPAGASRPHAQMKCKLISASSGELNQRQPISGKERLVLWGRMQTRPSACSTTLLPSEVV